MVHRYGVEGQRPRGRAPDAAVNRALFEPGAGTPIRKARSTPGEKHWYGATPETYMVHAAINIANTTGGGTEWLQPVKDDEYDES